MIRCWLIPARIVRRVVRPRPRIVRRAIAAKAFGAKAIVGGATLVCVATGGALALLGPPAAPAPLPPAPVVYVAPPLFTDAGPVIAAPVTNVPEPASLALFGVAVAGLLVARGRR